MAPYYLGSYILFLLVIIILITYNFYFLILEIIILKKEEINKNNFNYQLNKKIKDNKVHVPWEYELLFISNEIRVYKQNIKFDYSFNDIIRTSLVVHNSIVLQINSYDKVNPNYKKYYDQLTNYIEREK